MSPLSDYEQQTGDWRRSMRINSRKTRMVVIAFVLLYLIVGVCVDLVAITELYNATLQQAAYALFHGKVFPLATMIMFVIAMVSLLITYAMHDTIMLMGTDAKEIGPEGERTLQEQQLYNVIEEMKIAAGLNFMPRVFIIPANYMNAFASGFSEKSAMVAITQGLLEKLTREELKAVMAHELSHIRHLDIKLTLTVGILSNIMLLVIDLVFRFVIFGRNRDSKGNRLFLVIMILRFVVPIITLLLTFYLSRTREFMADAGAVQLMRDNTPMATALLKISDDHSANKEEYSQAYGDTPHEDVRRAAYLFDPVAAGVEPIQSIASLFSTHPTLAERLKAIGFIKRT